MRAATIIAFALAASVTLSAAGGALAAEIRVIDGDSFEMPDGEVVRVDNIDTPSIGEGVRCAAEREKGEQTVARVTELVAECPPVLDRRYRDGSGRTNARVSVCGEDLGELLMREGLAIFRDAPPAWCSAPAP